MIDTSNPEIVLYPGNVLDDERTEICNNLQVLYATPTGELALDRDYGIDISAVGYPPEHAQALLVAEYTRKTQRYEPRARVARVEWVSDAEKGKLTPKVVIEFVEH